MSKQKVTSLLGLIIAVLAFTSCAAPNYLPGPTLNYPTITNEVSFGIENMDKAAKIETTTLTCHYDGFDVQYKVLENATVSLEIINKSNKSLIIDKSKSYVLYNGYSNQLFKDVRSSRSTTFNNVQDAIDNVQTNEAGVSMSIPPYSKWAMPLQETNVRQIELPGFSYKEGIHNLTPYDNKETVEFVIPYSYDYSLAKWETCRNRFYVSSIEVKKGFVTYKPSDESIEWGSANGYSVMRSLGQPDYSEANRIDAINVRKYKSHRTWVTLSHILWGIPTLTYSWWLPPMLNDEGYGHCHSHVPMIYGNQYKHIRRN